MNEPNVDLMRRAANARTYKAEARQAQAEMVEEWLAKQARENDDV